MSEAAPHPGERGRFWRIAGAGAAFQAGASAIDSATIVASLVFQLTGSAFAVGFASAVLRLGWLLPQLVVGFLAERAERRMPFYVFGAYGRALMAGLIALLLWFGDGLSPVLLGVAFLALWTVYAFVSGVVAVPYNDIVGRSIRSEARSRMLAWRFFGGGIFALGVAAFVSLSLDILPSRQAYALIFGLAALLLVLSSSLFVSAGEPPLPPRQGEREAPRDVLSFLKDGWHVLSGDGRFRLFLYSQWLGGATLMALPFYVVAADKSGVTPADVGLLLGAQTAGALASNPVWGKLGDRAGKLTMLQTVAAIRILPPLIVLALLGLEAGVFGYMALFVVIGAMMNGVTIGYLGYLMEISPDDRRPAYSAYFNAMASPAALLPLFGAGLVSLVSIQAVFVAAILAALLQLVLLLRITKLAPKGTR
ncbi:MFS transporter (plasmid) [Sulfitobacter sp. W027]|uniref:MFS transporter n=1 Tax=Sulfitobacter sp. W027 TaxID=2867025 RepID=UPI0021A90FE0|nr:MFS transporter [Sulfitobacter sp. W027]UWR35591.1 MFS transporter [Sulfitobacter sp. W027]